MKKVFLFLTTLISLSALTIDGSAQIDRGELGSLTTVKDGLRRRRISSADYPALLLGVNLGGLGTLIASMASLISYKLYAAADGARTGKYILFFTAVNVVLLAVLWGAMVIIYK